MQWTCGCGWLTQGILTWPQCCNLKWPINTTSKIVDIHIRSVTTSTVLKFCKLLQFKLVQCTLRSRQLVTVQNLHWQISNLEKNFVIELFKPQLCERVADSCLIVHCLHILWMISHGSWLQLFINLSSHIVVYQRRITKKKFWLCVCVFVLQLSYLDLDWLHIVQILDCKNQGC